MAELRLISLALCLVFSGCTMSAGTASTRQQFVKDVGLSDYKNVTFKNVDGSTISYEQFAKLSEGHGFSMMKNPGKSTAIVKISADDAKSISQTLADPKLSIKVGGVAPKATHPDLQGRMLDYTQKPTVVSFFFTECVPCIKEIPKINSLMTELPDVQFVSVTFDDADAAKKFVAKYRLNTPVVADEQNYIDAMGVKSYPLYALIGKDGKLLGTQSGATLQLAVGETVFKNWVRSKLGT